MHVLLAAHQTASTAVLPVTLFMSFVLATPKLRRLCKYVASACIWRWYCDSLFFPCETVELCDHRSPLQAVSCCCRARSLPDELEIRYLGVAQTDHILTAAVQLHQHRPVALQQPTAPLIRCKMLHMLPRNTSALRSAVGTRTGPVLLSPILRQRSPCSIRCENQHLSGTKSVHALSRHSEAQLDASHGLQACSRGEH